MRLRASQRDVRPARLGRRGELAAAVLAALLLGAACARAARAGEEAEPSDGHRVYGGLEIIYDDNALLTKDNPDGDLIRVYAAGFEIERSGPSQTIKFEYQLRYRDYTDNSELDFAEQSGALRYEARANGFDVVVSEKMRITNDPFGVEYAYNQDRLLNDAEVKASLKMKNDGHVSLSYLNSINDCRDSDWSYLSYAENAVTLEVAIPVTESGKTVAFASVAIGSYKFDEDVLNGYSYTRGVVGIRGQTSPKVAFEAGAGLDSLGSFDNNLADSKDSGSSLVLFGRATWKIKPDVTRLEATLKSKDQPSPSSNYEIVTSGTVELFHRFLARLSGAFGAAFEKGDRSTGDDYSILRAWAGASYDINQRSSAFLRVEHANRQSTGGGAEYDANRISLGILLGF